MKSEKMTPLLQSMWLQVLWILWTLWFVLDPAWDLFASGVEWLLSMGVLGWFLGLVALALAVSLFRTYGPAGGILSIMATFLLLWGIGDGLPGALLPNPYQLLFILQDATYDNFVFFLLWLQGWVVCLGLIWVGARWFCKKFPPAGNGKKESTEIFSVLSFCVWRQPGSGAEGRDMV